MPVLTTVTRPALSGATSPDLMPQPGENVEDYVERLRRMHAQLTALLSAVERGLRSRPGASPIDVEPEILDAVPAPRPALIHDVPTATAAPHARPRPPAVARPIGAARLLVDQAPELVDDGHGGVAMIVSERREGQADRRISATDRRRPHAVDLRVGADRVERRTGQRSRRLGTDDRRLTGTRKAKRTQRQARWAIGEPAPAFAREGGAIAFWGVQLVVWLALLVVVIVVYVS